MDLIIGLKVMRLYIWADETQNTESMVHSISEMGYDVSAGVLRTRISKKIVQDSNR
jgi:hypothetical protein